MPVLKGAVQHYHASGQDDARYQIPKIAKSLKFQGYFMCRYGPSRSSAVCVKLLIVSRGGKDRRGIQGTPPRGRVVRLPSMCPTRPPIDNGVSEKRRRLQQQSMAQIPNHHLPLPQTPAQLQVSVPIPVNKEEPDPPKHKRVQEPSLRDSNRSYTTTHSPQPSSHTDAQCGGRMTKMVCDNAMPFPSIN